MATFTYEFEELPLVIHGAVEAGFINGQAEIIYSGSDWNIGDITLEGFGERDANGKRTWPQVPAPPSVAIIVRMRLEYDWQHKVQTAVSEQLASDREDTADMQADMRRDHLMGL